MQCVEGRDGALGPVVDRELEHIRPGIVPGHVEIELAAGDLAEVDFGIEDRLAFEVGPGEDGAKRVDDAGSGIVVGDRVMMQGSGQGKDEFGEIREQVLAFVAGHGTLAAAIPDPFYGDLQVYRVSYE